MKTKGGGCCAEGWSWTPERISFKFTPMKQGASWNFTAGAACAASAMVWGAPRGRLYLFPSAPQSRVPGAGASSFLPKSLQREIFTNALDWSESLKMGRFQFLFRGNKHSPLALEGAEHLPLGRLWVLPPLYVAVYAGNNPLGRGRIPTPLSPASSPTHTLPPPNPRDSQASTRRPDLQPREAVILCSLKPQKAILLLPFLRAENLELLANLKLPKRKLLTVSLEEGEENYPKPAEFSCSKTSSKIRDVGWNFPRPGKCLHPDTGRPAPH